MSTSDRPRILYLGQRKTPHDLRFLSALGELGEVDPHFLIEDETEISSEWLESNIDLIVVGPLGDALDSIPEGLSIPVLGISFAFDLNEESKDPLKKAQLLKNIQKLDAAIVDCDYIKNKLQEEFHFEKTITAIPYGCDFEFFSSIDVNPGKNLNILVTRNWSRIHGNSVVLRGLEVLARKMEFSASFLGSGDTLEETREEFKDLILSNNIEFYGYASKDDLYTHLAKNWCYVSAARSDGSSVSLMEAMSAGRVCVTSDFPSNREWIEDGVSGFTFRNGDAEDLANTLRKVSQTPNAKLVQIGLRARAIASSKGSWEINKGIFIRESERILTLGN